MENPFVFNKETDVLYFSNGHEEALHLHENLVHGINTILISPRRWGKTSLVKKVIADIHEESVQFVFIDLFPCKTEYDFYKKLVNAVIKQTSAKIEDCTEIAKEFLTNISPRFSFGSDPLNDFKISFEWEKKDGSEENFLSLPEKIAEKKGIRIVVCIDEFQQVSDFADSKTFQDKLRSIWQHQQNVTYCMLGTKNLMEYIFNDKNMPFYQFGDIIAMKKIPSREWVPFICDKFSKTEKIITEEQAWKICEVTECISSYIQHLSWIVWYKTESVVTNQIIDAAVKELLEQNKVFFQREIERLSKYQLNFLRALADGVTSGFSHMDIIRFYKLETSANIQRVKKSLMKKDIIYQDDWEILFDDSLLKLWVRNNIK